MNELTMQKMRLMQNLAERQNNLRCLLGNSNDQSRWIGCHHTRENRSVDNVDL